MASSSEKMALNSCARMSVKNQKQLLLVYSNIATQKHYILLDNLLSKCMIDRGAMKKWRVFKHATIQKMRPQMPKIKRDRN